MSGTQGTANSSAQSAVQEYVVRVPKPDKKRYHVMRFNASLKVNVEEWKQVRIERENNLKDFKTEEDMPKFGAGSEFGRDMREEARKKKYGIISKKYNPDDQPWLLRVGGKSGKRYRGIREGGIAENASYYVFTQANDGAFEAFPISEWYDFTPIQTYKTLNAEEAEEEFGRRDKVFNYFSIMLKKRLKNEEEGDGEGEEKNKKKEKKKAKGAGDFKISDMDDWINSSDEDEDEDEGGSDKDDKQRAEKDKGKKNQPSKKKPNKKKKKDESDDEAWEDSDDGDEEGREVDYITDESSNNSDNEVDIKGKAEMTGVEDEEAIRKMEDSESEEENPDTKKETPEVKEETPAKEKAPKDKKEKKEGISSSSSSDTSDSDDFDNDTSFQSAMFMQDRIKNKKAQRKIKKENAQNAQSKSGSNSRSNTPTKAVEKSTMIGGLKRPVPDNEKEGTSAKRSKLDAPGMSGSYSSHSMDGISEDSVRRYLMRKPMTTTELLQKFKSKKTGLGRDQMVNTLTQILKRLNPERQMIKGKMYLSMKQSH